MKEKNSLREAVLTIKDYWQYRRKGLEVPATIYDTIQALYRKDEVKPQIMKRQQIENGWWFLVHLPPGTGFLKFKSYETLFAEAVGGQVFIEMKGKAVHLKAYETQLGEYPYAKHVSSEMFKGMLLPLHFGYCATGPVIKDLAKLEGILIGGNRGTGKSNLVITLVENLLLYSDALIGIIDYNTVDTMQFKPYTAYADDDETARALIRAIKKEMANRKKLFAQHGCNKLEKMRAKGFNIKPVVLFGDELAEITDEETLDTINHLLRTCRKFGFYMVGATQRPSSTNMKRHWGDSKMLLPTRVCFSVPDAINSQIILDNDKGASLPKDKRGRCIFQFTDSIEVQTLKLEPEEAEQLLKKSVTQTKEVMNFYEQLPEKLPPRQSHTVNDKPIGGVRCLSDKAPIFSGFKPE